MTARRTPFVELLAADELGVLQNLRMLAFDLLRLARRSEPPMAWVDAIVHSHGRSLRDALRGRWEDELELRTEVGTLCANVALGESSVQGGRAMLRRVCHALTELGVTRADVERTIRRRAAEPVEPSGEAAHA